MSTKRRKVVGPEGRAIIARVYRFLRQEYEFTKLYMEPNCDLSHLRDVSRRTAEATGVSTRTVRRILKEDKEFVPTSPEPEHTPPIKKSKNEDSSNEDSNNEDSNNEDSTNEDSKNEISKNDNSKNKDSKNEEKEIECKVEIELENLTDDAVEKMKQEPLSDCE